MTSKHARGRAVRLVLLLLGVLGALVISGAGSASAEAGVAGFVVQVESDAGTGSDLYTLVRYATYQDLVDDTNRISVDAAEPRLAFDASTTGLTWDGTHYIVQVESDAGTGSDLYTLVRYATYQDLVDDTNRISVDAAEPRLAFDASTTGLTWDGTHYIVQVESDAGTGSDLYTLVRYATYQDLVDDTNRISVDAAEPRLAFDASTTGLTWDGTHYIVQVESDAGTGSDLYTLVRYATYQDLVDDTNRISVDAAEPRLAFDASTTGLLSFPAALVDSDGDGVPDGSDVCPGENDAVDVDADGIPDCVDPFIDRDGDGVADADDEAPDDPTRSVFCDPGYFGAFSCQPAPKGTFVDTEGALEPTPCPIGRFSADEAAVDCEAAPIGTYVDSEGAEQPTTCPDGTSTEAIASTSLDDCIPDSDGDGLPDTIDPDDDGDGVDDLEDRCPATVLGDGDQPESPKKNRYWAHDDGRFIDVGGRDSGFTVVDAGGCAAGQIVELAGLGAGHSRFGITKSALIDWFESL